MIEGMWSVDSGKPGTHLCISFGVHGNERPPIDAGLELAARIERGELELARGRLLLVHSNPRASAEDQRWSEGGIDLNRCFNASVLARDPESYEEGRAREIVTALEENETQVLVDFHCTVEPGPRFLMQHPPIDEPRHRDVYRLLRAEVILSDPHLYFGSVSLDEWMSMRDRVGICYETGWIGDPVNSPEFVLGEMENVLRGLGLLEGRDATVHEGKSLVELESAVICRTEGFRWRDGVGNNLQALAAGTVLGAYPDGGEVVLEADSTLIFPKKRPEMVQVGKPLVYLAIRKG